MGSESATRIVGQLLKDRYLVEAELHVGPDSTVYAGRDRKHGRVAIKVLPKADTSALRRSYLANAVGHPSVVNVLDTGTDADGSMFLVMERLQATSLREILREHGGRLPIRLACDIVDQALDLLVCAHAQGITHGELDVDHIFWTTFGQLKVLGFGKHGPSTPAPPVLGSSHEGAPPGTLSAHSADDVRALSRLFTCLVTGDSTAAALQRAVPARIAAVMQKGLEANAERGGPSALRMRAALQQACRRELGRVSDRDLPPSAADEQAKSSSRVRWLAPLALLGLALLWWADAPAAAPAGHAAEPMPTAHTPPEPPEPASPNVGEQQAPTPSGSSLPEHSGRPGVDATTTAPGNTDTPLAAADGERPVRVVPRGPPAPELLELMKPRSRVAVPAPKLAVREFCAELRQARSARNWSDEEERLWLARCTMH